jgi:hypothetical protein
MAKIETAAQFKALMVDGKYENKINAQRAAGRTRLPDGEKKKAFAAIEEHFGSDGSSAAAAAPKPSKKVAKKAAKKAAKKKAVAKPATPVATPTPVAAAPASAPAGKKKAKKKAGKKKVVGRKPTGTPVEEAAAPPGTLPISPSEVTSVAGVLQVIDSTVTQSVGIARALQQADEINKTGDISAGIQYVKNTLTRAAQLLQESVVDPLRKAGTQADPEVASRLQAVVASAGEPFAQQAPPGQEMHTGMAPANAVS